jgi:hypothetical protein
MKNFAEGLSRRFISHIKNSGRFGATLPTTFANRPVISRKSPKILKATPLAQKFGPNGRKERKLLYLILFWGRSGGASRRPA